MQNCFEWVAETSWVFFTEVVQFLWPTAQPGGAEPAPPGRHDGAGHGRPHVLRAGQGDGSASKLSRLHLLPQAGPGPRGLSGISRNFANNQSQGQRSSVTAYWKLSPTHWPTVLFPLRETWCSGTGGPFLMATVGQSVPGYPFTPLMAGMF